MADDQDLDEYGLVEKYRQECAQLFKIYAKNREDQKRTIQEALKNPSLSNLVMLIQNNGLDLTYLSDVWSYLGCEEVTSNENKKEAVVPVPHFGFDLDEVEHEPISDLVKYDQQETMASALSDKESEPPRLDVVFTKQEWLDWLLLHEFKDETNSLEPLKSAIAIAVSANVKEGKAPFEDVEYQEPPVQDNVLIPTKFECKILPPCVTLGEGSQLSALTSAHIEFVISNEADTSDENSIREELRWFGRYLKYRPHVKDKKLKAGSKKFKPDLSLSGEYLQASIDSLSKCFQGIEDVQRQMSLGFRLFESTKTLPRGILLHGPPGTGKTSIIVELCKLLNIQLVAPMLSAGDFAKPLQGQSEAMINQLAERADLVPWRLCCVVVDEIESLVVKREGKGGGGDSSKLSVLLSRIGGVSDVPNLMFFAATNHPEQMDAAFMRRMKVKIFVGPPTRVGRARFVHSMAADLFDTKNHKCMPDIKAGYYDPNCENNGCRLEQAVVSLMINYAAAQMQGALTRFRSILKSATEVGDRFSLLRETLAQFTEEEGVLISTRNQVTILAPVVRPSSRSALSQLVENMVDLESCFDPNNVASTACSRRVLIDMSVLQGHIQVELDRRVFTAAQMSFIKDVVEGPKAFRDRGCSHLSMLVHPNVDPLKDLKGTVESLRLAFEDQRDTAPLIAPFVKAWTTQMDLWSAKQMLESVNSLDKFLSCNPCIALSQSGDVDQQKLKEMFNNRRKGKDCPVYRKLFLQLETRRREEGLVLHDKLVKLFPEDIQMEKEKYKCFSFARKPADISSDELLALVFHLANVSNVSRALLICREFFHANGICSEGDMELYLHQQINTLRNNYKSGLLCIDLDSLANPGSDNTEKNFDNMQLLASLMASIRLASGAGIWCVCFSRHASLLRRFRSYHSWPLFKDPNPLSLCLNCGRNFRETQNRKDACGKHSGTLEEYNDAQPPKVIRTIVKANDLEERKRVLARMSRGELKWSALRWSCCGQHLFSHGGGEIPWEHELLIEKASSVSRDSEDSLPTWA